MANIRDNKETHDETGAAPQDDTRARTRSNGGALEDELREAGERFSAGARQFGEAAAEQIRQHPLAAAGIAFAAGAIVARWLRGR